MTNELSVFMQDLPQHVRNLDDAKRMAFKLGGDATTLFWKGTINRTIKYIQPDEPLYIFTWGVTCSFTDRATGEQWSTSGAIFLSGQRFFYFDGSIGYEKIELPLEAILTVAAQEGTFSRSISFRTASATMEVKFLDSPNVNMVRDMIIHLSANATTQLEASGTGAKPASQSVVDCSGCGATVIIHQNTINKCAYCDRFVQEQPEAVNPQVAPPVAAPKAPPSSGSVADELLKYKELLNMGAINADEFEAAKRKLLGNL